MSRKGAFPMAEQQTVPKLWTKDFVFIAIVNFLLFASWQTFPFVLPLYLQNLGVSDVLLGWVTAVTTIAALLIRPFCGFILDRFGRKGMLLAGIALMCLATVSYAFFPFVGVIFAIRFMHGLAWGVASTSCQTVASDVIPPKRFGEGMGLYALSASLALAIAPGLALELFGHQGLIPVLVLGAGALCIAFVLALTLRYRIVEEPQPFRLKGMFEKRSITPTAIMFFLSACYGALTTFLAIHAAAQGVESIGAFFTAYAAAVALSRPFLGKLVDSKGYAVIIFPGLILMASALVILSMATSLALFILVAFLYGTGFACCQSTLQTMAVADAPLNRRGAANATFLVGFDLGIGFGAVVSGFIVSLIGYSGLYLSFAFMPLVAGALFFAFARKRKPPRLQGVDGKQDENMDSIS